VSNHVVGYIYVPDAHPQATTTSLLTQENNTGFANLSPLSSPAIFLADYGTSVQNMSLQRHLLSVAASRHGYRESDRLRSSDHPATGTPGIVNLDAVRETLATFKARRLTRRRGPFVSRRAMRQALILGVSSPRGTRRKYMRPAATLIVISNVS
jgi:hypothetical protein